MNESGRGLWRSSGPTLLLKLRYLELVAQDHIWTFFYCVQRSRLHNISGQPVPWFSHPNSKKWLLDIERPFSVLHCVLTLLSFHWASLKRHWLPPLCIIPSGMYVCCYVHKCLKPLWSPGRQYSLHLPGKSIPHRSFKSCQALISPGGSMLTTLFSPP